MKLNLFKLGVLNVLFIGLHHNTLANNCGTIISTDTEKDLVGEWRSEKHLDPKGYTQKTTTPRNTDDCMTTTMTMTIAFTSFKAAQGISRDLTHV